MRGAQLIPPQPWPRLKPRWTSGSRSCVGTCSPRPSAKAHRLTGAPAGLSSARPARPAVCHSSRVANARASCAPPAVMSRSTAPMAAARFVERVFSPLDDELALLPGLLAPSLHGWLVRLSSCVPFAQAATLLSEFAHVRLSEGTAQRLTYAAGGAVVAQQTCEAERIIKDAPPPQEGPDCLLLSADGAMVPLV